VAAVAVAIGLWVLGDQPKKFTKVTAGCGMVPTATVRRWVPQPTANDYGSDGLVDRMQIARTQCKWSSPGTSTGLFRQLAMDVDVERDVPRVIDSDSPKGLDRAKSTQRNQRRQLAGKAGTTVDLGGGYAEYYGRLTTLHGAGEEGFVIATRNRLPIGLMEEVNVYVRWGNAGVHVEYLSGQYRGGQMTPTAESVTREGAEAVTREIVRYLAHCTECAR
jgi:hypothetical protein